MSMNHVSNLGQLNFKIVLLGEGCVGKTSLVLRYVEDKFHEKHFSTIQVSSTGTQRFTVFSEVKKFPITGLFLNQKNQPGWTAGDSGHLGHSW